MESKVMMGLRSSGIWALCLTIVVAGCSSKPKSGPKAVAASGKVTYKNLPVEGATVSFLGDGTIPPAVATTDSSGEFILTTSRSGDGAVPGKHQVTVTKIVGPPVKAAKTKMTMEEAAEAAKEAAAAKPLSMLPERYATVDTSGLQYEVKASGTNNFEIKLEE
jgi:hypothetical protein